MGDLSHTNLQNSSVEYKDTTNKTTVFYQVFKMEINTSGGNIIGETGVVDNLDHNTQTISLERNYTNPVIFAQPLSYNGSQTAIVRLEDIKEDRFTASIQEPNNLDGKHIDESFSYLVLEAGTWQLEDDTVLEVGELDTNLLSPNGWENVDFTNDFAKDPLVFSQVQTNNDKDFVYTRQRNTDSSGFQITMQEEEALNDSGHGNETVGWFAITAGNGNLGQNNYLAGQTGNSINHKWKTINFNNNFSQPPVLLASMATFNGEDSSGLRSRNLSKDGINIKIEEDTSKDAETYHINETVNFFAIAGNNLLHGVPLGEKPKEEAKEVKVSDENWDVIYDGLNQSEPLEIIGMDNVLIRNSTFNNINSSDAIYIRDSNNIHVENVTINNTVNNDAIDIRYSDDIHIDELVVNKISGDDGLSGVRIWQSTDIMIEDSEFSSIFSSGHSAAIRIIPGELSANITINNNYIHNTYGNGIDSGAYNDNYHHDTPVPGLKITNNLIHDIGKTPSPDLKSPTHGMYIKAQDPYIANNTVYNSWDGEGISIRSTAVVKNNKIWDTKKAALAFYQHKPAGSSMKSVIENNELFFTKSRPVGAGGHEIQPLLKLYYVEGKGPLHYNSFEVRNNKLSIQEDIIGNPPLMELYPFENLTVSGNNFIDRREKTNFFRYLKNSSIRYEEQNTNSFNK